MELWLNVVDRRSEMSVLRLTGLLEYLAAVTAQDLKRLRQDGELSAVQLHGPSLHAIRLACTILSTFAQADSTPSSGITCTAHFVLAGWLLSYVENEAMVSTSEIRHASMEAAAHDSIEEATANCADTPMLCLRTLLHTLEMTFDRLNGQQQRMVLSAARSTDEPKRASIIAWWSTQPMSKPRHAMRLAESTFLSAPSSLDDIARLVPGLLNAAGEPNQHSL